MIGPPRREPEVIDMQSPSRRSPRRLGEGLRHAAATLREGVRYHGLWSPGVRVLQNLQFRHKGWLLLALVLVPMAYLTSLEWRRNHDDSTAWARSDEAMTLYVASMRASDQVAELERAMFLVELGQGDAAGIRRALADEDQGFAALQAQVNAAERVAASVHGHVGAAATLREQMRRLALDESPGQGTTPPPRYRAARAFDQQLNRVRLTLLRLAGLAARNDELNTALFRGALEPLPALEGDLRHLSRAGSRVYSGADRAAIGRRLADYLAEMRLREEQAVLELEPALGAGWVDQDLAREAHGRVQLFAEQAARLVRASMTAESERDVTLAVGVDAAGLRQSAEVATQALRRLHDAALARSSANVHALHEAAESQARWAVLLLVLGLSSVVYLMICMNKVVGGGLRELCSRVDALAAGDLSDKPPAWGRDEVGHALNALAHSVRRMSSLFEAVTQGVAAVSHASREVASGNAGLSGRTSDIRQSIGEVSERAQGFMDAMSACSTEVERIAEHMRDVRADAHRSRKAMDSLQDRMNGLQQKSREITRVVSLVEVISHQTRLLSLNASVEAARAGAAGKGFAVVAQEVRDLARRSEAAARKIYDIVNASVAEIEQGGILTERVGESVRNTDERIAQVSNIVTDIVGLTRSGHSQSREVVHIAHDVAESVNGNARMVDQLAHASEDLRAQGDHLKRSMQHFVFE